MTTDPTIAGDTLEGYVATAFAHTLDCQERGPICSCSPLERVHAAWDTLGRYLQDDRTTARAMGLSNRLARIDEEQAIHANLHGLFVRALEGGGDCPVCLVRGA